METSKSSLLPNAPKTRCTERLFVYDPNPIPAPLHAAVRIIDKWCILMYHLYMLMYIRCLSIHHTYFAKE